MTYRYVRQLNLLLWLRFRKAKEGSWCDSKQTNKKTNILCWSVTWVSSLKRFQEDHGTHMHKDKTWNNSKHCFYLLTPGCSSFTTTLLLHAMRSLSVAIWLLGALWCICRTPSIWPLRLSPTFGGEAISKLGLLKATKTNQKTNQLPPPCLLYQKKTNEHWILLHLSRRITGDDSYC